MRTTTEKKVRSPARTGENLERGRAPKGFKPDVATGSIEKPERDHIRLRGVGFPQYRKLIASAQGGADRPSCGPFGPFSGLRWLDDDQNNNAYHEGGYNLIDNTIEFWTHHIAVGSEIAYAAGEITVNGGHQDDESQFTLKPAD